MMGGAQVTLLGQFEVSVDGRTVEIKSSKERALLARLALAPGTVVAADSLIDAIWPDETPNDPPRALRYHVWHLRDLLERRWFELHLGCGHQGQLLERCRLGMHATMTCSVANVGSRAPSNLKCSGGDRISTIR